MNNKLKNQKRMLEIYTDGASRGNPGPAAFAFIFKDKKGNEFYNGSGYLGETTNNSAEYTAILNALRAAEKFTSGQIKLFSDSQLVVRQLNKEYRVNKSHLLEFREKIYDQSQNFKKVEFFHVNRSHPMIQKCDALCNKRLDDLSI